MASNYLYCGLRPVTTLLLFTTILISILPPPSLAETELSGSSSCSGEATLGSCYNKDESVKLKVIAIFTILIASIIGIGLPMFSTSLPALHPDRKTFILVKALAAGVILSTGFMHVLPDSWNDLTSECLPERPWREYPISTFVTMVTAVFTMAMDTLATAFFKKRAAGKRSVLYQAHQHGCGVVLPDGGNDVGDQEVGTDHLKKDELEKSSQLLRFRIVAQVLELGIVVHSVVIGLSMGVSNSTCLIRSLIAAMCFHQLFEGMGLGGCIMQAEYKFRMKFTLAVFFSTTTPFGIALGMGLMNVYDQDSPAALIIVGILNAISSGLLIYMALVNLLAADFMSPRLQSDMKLQIQGYGAVCIGMAGMSVMAKWA